MCQLLTKDFFFGTYLLSSNLNIFHSIKPGNGHVAAIHHRPVLQHSVNKNSWSFRIRVKKISAQPLTRGFETDCYFYSSDKESKTSFYRTHQKALNKLLNFV